MKNIQRLLADSDPLKGVDLTAAHQSAEATELLTRTTREPFAPTSRRTGQRATNGGRLVVAAGLALIVLCAGVFVAGTLRNSPRGAKRTATVGVRLVSFRDSSDEIVAIITDPQAASEQLSQVFKAHGLDIEINAVPVSPSLVGSIVYTDVDTIKSIQDGSCITGGSNGCQVGLVIPADFTGKATVTLGRAAASNETYSGSADVFGAGEALHCSGLLGGTVEATSSVLDSKGLTADWMINGQRVGSAPGSDVIIGGTATSPTTVLLEVSDSTPATRAFHQNKAASESGC